MLIIFLHNIIVIIINYFVAMIILESYYFHNLDYLIILLCETYENYCDIYLINMQEQI